MSEILKNKIREQSKNLGFNLVGFTIPKAESGHLKAFNSWLENGYEGCMGYLHKKEQRENLLKILPKAAAVITLATNYYHEQGPLKPGNGKIARYAYGRDYHKIIKKRLIKLEKYIQEIAPDAETKSYVDTGPILEKALAEQSGLGVIGKNSCLITKEYGSWVFLSEIITTLPLSPDHVARDKEFSVCGSCRLCIDACPTGAIVAAGVVDARRCISYLTIENKDEEIPEEFKQIIRKTKRLYGCDICQEVCPHNSRSKDMGEISKIAGDELDLKQVLSIKSGQEFLETFAGSPLMRAKKTGLQRNAKVLLGLAGKKKEQVRKSV